MMMTINVLIVLVDVIVTKF